MIRGWRLDPRWVEYYARRDAERAARKLELLKRQKTLQQIIESVRQDVKTLEERELKKTRANAT